MWNQEAKYLYYPHGPLARVELGERSVQGLDYYYTLQGWLKGVNGTHGSNDPGADGSGTSRVAKDAFAFQLGYYEGDYQGIGAMPTNNQLWNRLNEQLAYKGLHNGNIAWMQTDLPGLKTQGNNAQQAMLYQYDQLNRLVQAQSLRNFSEASGFAARGASPEAFDTKYAYDPNGNLTTLKRNNVQGSLMDDFSYTYTSGTNRLATLGEAVPPDTTFFDTKTYNSGVLKPDGKVYREITVEGSTTAEQGTNPQLKANEVITLKQNFHAKAGSGFHAKWVQEPNYEIQDDNADFTYDEIGNLIGDSGAGTNISWTPYGKVRKVKKGDDMTVTYRYDGAGNRVEKKVVASDSSYITRYIRDASGNVLAIYQNDSLLEQPIYGSSRLGMYQGGTATGHEMLGNRRYELSNHLGNVLAVITDNIHMDADSTWATVESTQDYMPFGLAMKGRSHNDNLPGKLGFNGMRQAEEIDSNHYTTKFRELDTELGGRWWSIDPKSQQFPGWSPYAFSFNNPILLNDPDGDCPPGVDCDNPLPNMERIRVNRASNLGPGSVRNNGNRFHNGHDLYAASGTEVRSVMSGEVIHAGFINGYGNSVTIKHTVTARDNQGNFVVDANDVVQSQTYYSFYSHMGSLDVGVGNNVDVGQRIGASGTSGNATGLKGVDQHLHFELGTSLQSNGLLLNRNDLVDPNLGYNRVRFETMDPYSGNEIQNRTGVIKSEYDGNGDIQRMTIQFYESPNSNGADVTFENNRRDER